MKSQPPAGAAHRGSLLPSVFAGLFGAFLGLSLLKFGNPPITEKWVTAPAELDELFFCYPWPIVWAYGLLALVVVAGIAVARWKSPAPRWLVALPLVWLGWEFLATTQSADPALSQATLKHFVACAVCFYLGYFSLSRVERLWPFWIGLLGGFLLVILAGWNQHFGGLEASRRYFFLYVYPQLKEVSPDYLKKLNSDRIFATLFYPNALAGALLLLLPVVLAVVWQSRALLTPAARGLLMGLVAVPSLVCLYWSGSKGGWLLMLVLGLVWLLRLPFSRRLKVTLVIGVLLAGLTGFVWRYAGFFQKGATSVSARLDYWHAAAQTVKNEPLLGSGPGTFAIAYQKVKRPESEMARLTHNDYLQQASDSGVVGFLAYTLFILGALACSFPRTCGTASARTAEPWLVFGVWLGVLGWSLQSLFEFGLYIPALAWPAFTFLGWLLGRKTPTPSKPVRPRANP
jgi:O-antigen ligase